MNVFRSSRGFTLVEVLIATTLLSLVMLGLLTAMRSIAQTETRIDERIRGDDDWRVSERFLRTIMASVSPRQRDATAGAPRRIDFSGGADALQWIGVMPARHGAGGLYRFRLYTRPAIADAPAALMLEFSPYVPGFEAPPDPGAVQSRALVSGISGAGFRYQDDLTPGEPWVSDWPHADRLPRRIALSVAGATRPWPEVVVAVTPTTGPVLAARRGAVTSNAATEPF